MNLSSKLIMCTVLPVRLPQFAFPLNSWPVLLVDRARPWHRTAALRRGDRRVVSMLEMRGGVPVTGST